MKDRRMDRFVVLPFSVGCVSQSSVAVCENQPRRAQAEAASAPPSERSCSAKPRGSFNLPMFPRPNLSAGFQKLVKSFKSFSQLFVIDNKEDDGEIEMEIGFPTDVQHVGHIGWDGFSTMSTTSENWDRAPEQFLSLPSAAFSLKQLELAMAAQAGVASPPPPSPHGPLGA